MKYKHKLIECPYRSTNSKCTHKHIRKRVSKRKRVCGYDKPNNCDMYLEWFELSNDTILKEKSNLPPLKAKLGLSKK